ncbi:hypothetical protein K504DRAFT_96230 [Pleomassaria siparia CBS 279.74]|uniref:C2H2-type domain-containing protein n=1 Tax=Pleomassaria siparia CBS 279.74 TaxID=1314801 RepID=A0A6G1JY17_9PLEO|nr:hypothetical protein K504DRAFT_96230 [Pleomassaria siparia CBS 279.74]
MKSWFHSHRLRKSRSEALLPMERYNSSEIDDAIPNSTISNQINGASRIATSKTASRMSIERYLSAPLEDEPASVPAIDAALRRQTSQSYTSRIPVPVVARANHSRETSLDANSDGRRTFYTSGSAPDSTGTSYSAVSKTARSVNHHQRNRTLTDVPELPKPESLYDDHSTIRSPERPTTSGTVDMEKTWAGQMDKFMPGYSPDKKIDYKAKADEELARIQEKARQLEERMIRYREESTRPEPPRTRVTDEMAYARMVAQPKLAWILGGDVSDTKVIERPKSSGSVHVSSSAGLPERPKTSGSATAAFPGQVPRRTKSSGALDERVRQAAIEKKNLGGLERKGSKRHKFHCTFCHKKFQTPQDWMRHERTIHMPEELWVCCPRTGRFPKTCPFCAKSNPSSSHLAGHNYLTCQEKALSERTFSSKDHFLQHVAQTHQLSPEQKPLRLAELLKAWRHSLPPKQGHKALYCGFCGTAFLSYQERTEHVKWHFMEGLDMMSWWEGRVSHEINQPGPSEMVSTNANMPHRCAYCDRTYPNRAAAQKLHAVCTMWSCSFLPGMQYTIYPAGSRCKLEAVCCFCNETLVKGDGKVKGSMLKEHINQHNFRNCNQRLYFSGQRFRQHLQDNHRTNFDASLFAGWTLLLKSSKKVKPAILEPVEASVAVRRAFTDPAATTAKPPKKQEMAQMPRMNFMDFSETPQRGEAPKKKVHRKASSQTLPMPEKADGREVRNSTRIFTRAAAMDVVHGATASLPSSPKTRSQQDKTGLSIASLPVDAVKTCPRFYRRRLEVSTRNRLYIRDQNDGPLSKNSQKVFRKVPGSGFGGLILHSSLVGAVPAKLTNAVDVYSLH